MCLEFGPHRHSDDVFDCLDDYRGQARMVHPLLKKTFLQRNNIFLGAAGDGAALIVGVLGTHETSRLYKWHSRGGW